MPFGINTQAELFDMIMVVHNLNPAVSSDVAFAESRVRSETIAAENVLHDLGAISMFSSDSQAMGSVGENWLRVMQTANVSGSTSMRGRAPQRQLRNYSALRRGPGHLARSLVRPRIVRCVFRKFCRLAHAREARSR